MFPVRAYSRRRPALFVPPTRCGKESVPSTRGKFGRHRGPAKPSSPMLCSYLPPSPHFRRNVHVLGEEHITVAGTTAAGAAGSCSSSPIRGRSDQELIVARLNVDFDIRDGTARISHFRTEKLFVLASARQRRLTNNQHRTCKTSKEYR